MLAKVSIYDYFNDENQKKWMHNIVIKIQFI